MKVLYCVQITGLTFADTFVFETEEDRFWFLKSIENSHFEKFCYEKKVEEAA